MTSPDPPCTCAAEDAPRHLHANYCPRHGALPVLVLTDPDNRGTIRQDAVRVYRDWPNDVRRQLMTELGHANALGDPEGAAAMLVVLRRYFTVYVATPLVPVAAEPRPRRTALAGSATATCSCGATLAVSWALGAGMPDDLADQLTAFSAAHQAHSAGHSLAKVL